MDKKKTRKWITGNEAAAKVRQEQADEGLLLAGSGDRKEEQFYAAPLRIRVGAGLDEQAGAHSGPSSQQNYGNLATLRLHRRGLAVQPKLRTAESGDISEREADRLAENVASGRDEVTRLSPVEAQIQRTPADEAAAPPETVTTPTPAPPTEAETAPATATPVSGLIVDDAETAPGPGQMTKTEFLAQLREAVCLTAEEALTGTIWSAMGCPWIDYWFAYYGGRDSRSVEGAVRRYAPNASGVTSAGDYIPLICARVRSAIATWASTGEAAGTPAVSPSAGAAEGGAPPGIAAGLFLKGSGGGAGASSDPAAVQAQLGGGRPLDSGLKSRMESALAVDLSSVRVHTDTKAARLSAGLSARAFTVGRDIAFGAGEYRPGTPEGDVLIAHELAHVIQQGGGRSSAKPMEKGKEDSRLEKEADSSAVSAVASLWGWARGTIMPRLKSGLRLQRCGKKAEKIPAPDYLGPESQEALKEINRIIENSDLLGKMIVFGTVVTVATNPPTETLATGGHDVTPQAQALAAIPSIRRNRIETVITLLLVEHENDMNAQERAFWQRILDGLEAAQ